MQHRLCKHIYTHKQIKYSTYDCSLHVLQDFIFRFKGVITSHRTRSEQNPKT